MKPKVLILTGYGINCDYETKYSFEKAGAIADRVHINELISGKYKLEDYQIFFVPGGFSYGDDLGAGKVLANKLMFNLGDKIIQYIKDGFLVGGHCNGAQVLIKTGLLPAVDGNYELQTATLTNNDGGTFIDKWVSVKSVSEKCVWTRGLPDMDLPIRHGEGKFYSKDPSVIKKLQDNDQIALLYLTENPNGSILDIAGICDPSGRVFAQMPHHEAFNNLMNHPTWTRYVREIIRQGKSLEDINWDGEGLALFRNATNYAIENLT